MENCFNVINFIQLSTWDINRIFQNDRLEGMVPLSSFLKQYQKVVSKEEAIDKHLYIVSKISFGGTLYLNDFDKIYTVKGSLYEIPKNAITYSKINVRHGCCYWNTTSNSILASSEYPTFIVDENKVLPEYLIMVLRHPRTLKQFNSKLRGFTKARVSVTEFLLTKIPLPSIERQRELVAQYDALLNLAKDKENQADAMEQSIDDYLMAELGIKKEIHIDKNPLFNIIQYKQLYKTWKPVFKKELNISEISLEDACIFVKRKWSRLDRTSFDYIEINSIDKNQQILTTTHIETKKAPSRATQEVKTGDLLIATTRPYLKKFAIVSNKNNNDICSSGFQILNAKRGFDIEFIKIFLSSNEGVSRLSQKMTGAIYQVINTNDLKKIQIPNYPLVKQEKIVKEITLRKEQIKSLREESEILRLQALSDFEKEVFN